MKILTDYQKHQKSLADISYSIEEIRDAYGSIGVAHSKSIPIEDVERDMIIRTALTVIGAAFIRLDEIYSAEKTN